MLVRPGLDDAVVDTPDGIVVDGAAPGGRVELRCEVVLGGRSWTCRAEFTATADGSVDTSRHPSVSGDYTGVDPFGMFWSADAGARMDLAELAPMQVSVTAVSGEQRVEASYRRPWVRTGTTVRDMAEAGVVGRLHRPATAGLRGVVVVGGSDGGLGGPSVSPLLAGHGVAALSLAYWRHPGLPAALHDIDVEVVGRACDWLRGQPGVRDERPTVIGISRGGELALLAASLMPERVGSVVSIVGSGVAWGAVGTDDDNDTAWRFAGEPVPQVWEDPDDPDAALLDPARVAAAEILVERIDGRVLLLSGEADALWPSASLSELAVRRAERLGVADRVVHVAYPDAGHACCQTPGYAIQDGIVRHPLDGFEFRLGGTRAGNQAARLDSWRRVRELVTEPAW
jgi:pimeloyl-ACP methyl ester carboxylesterase